MADAIGTLRENIEAFNAGDWDRVAATIAKDGVYVEAGTQRRTVGPAANLELMKGWKAAFPDATGTITNTFGSGNQAVAEITWTGTHDGDMESPEGTIPATGRKINLDACIAVTVENGEIKESHQYFDLMTMMQQLGVVPEPAAAT